ncbi:uncharacterized protein LOC126561555 [Anopheles maculipalpis]|uniref:uncharacterized protein LOC126561555 n=1 Tax=Anopheles maculipalpis TaxID=1496333 RepID=UPI0021593AED|nr:uncharacterized protein LOC126561555 [Anopheles maculipalpis]
MITKCRLSDNASLGDVSTPISGSDSNTEETTCESMHRDDPCSIDQQSNDCGRYRPPGSNQKKRLPGSLLSDDSCNAVDNMLGVTDDQAQNEKGCREADHNADLSFNGKIRTLASGSQIVTPRRPSINTIDGLTAVKATVPEVATDVSNKNDLLNREKKFNESFELLTKECNTLNYYNNEKSPDLFADDDETEQEKENQDHSMHRSYQRVSGTGTKELECEAENSVDQTDHMLLKRMKMSLSGIPPPPALTYSDIDVGTMLTIYRSNVKSWLTTHGFQKNTAEQVTEGEAEKEQQPQQHQQQECLLKPTHSTDELTNMKWPELTKHRAHGLHYNRSRMSETFELLGLKYIERYISAETSCSFNMTILQSSAKKRNQRLKMLNQSPGRRLSHLARRRATFSSESLLNTSGSKSGNIVSAGKGPIDAGVLRRLNPHRACNNRQVLLDPKKSDNRRKNKIKTPKRRTPGEKKSPRRRTPGSSSKKLSLLRASAGGKSCTQVHVPATRESSKRALFLSPQNSDKLLSPARYDLRFSLGSNSKQTERSIFSEARILKSKRSLFSQTRGTAESSGAESIASISIGTTSTTTNAIPTAAMSNKRRRSSIIDNDDGAGNALGERTEKIRRTECSGLTEEDLTPRSLKFARSKSFCVGLQSTGLPSAATSDVISAPGIGGKTLIRANSEISSADGPRPLVMLTENHKKKLLWAVSQALQSKQITAKHELFKQHASNLVRVVKRLFLEFNDQTTSSTSEKLLKLANKHVYEVIQGKSVDDIYFREKTRIMNARNMPKLQGYIAPEEYELRQLKRTASITSFDGSSPFDCSLSASQSFLSQSSMLSQGSSFGGLSQLSQTNSFVRGGSHLKTASSTGSVNTVGLSTVATNTALRENVDSELRQRSTKKQLLFSGKDQKNVSPFRMEKNLSLIGSNVNTNKLLVGGSLNSSIMKAKRQISFE